MPTYGRYPLTLVEGKGARVKDADGRSYLDFCMGIAVCSLGHCHPRVVNAICEQANHLTHVSNLYFTNPQGLLAEEIVRNHIGIPGKVFFSNSGAEANDGLIKAARRYGHLRPQADGSPRFEVITFQQSFHGRTLGSMAATGQEKIRHGFDPLLPGFRYIPYNDLSALRDCVRKETVGVLLEPVQGEGGVNVATADSLRAASDLCKEHDLLLMFDEVQAGFGRCGKSMAWTVNAPEVVPDGISWAKGMGGGVPIGAFWLADRQVEGTGFQLSTMLGPGSHGSTYGGNPLVCAAALETLKEIRERNLADHANRVGRKIRDEIDSWDLPTITGTRGLGLLIGIGLDPQSFDHPEEANAALHISKLLITNGLLTVPAGAHTLRLLPPLNVTSAEVDEALRILKTTFAELSLTVAL